MLFSQWSDCLSESSQEWGILHMDNFEIWRVWLNRPGVNFGTVLLQLASNWHMYCKPKWETLSYRMKLNVCKEAINWLPSLLYRNVALEACLFQRSLVLIKKDSTLQARTFGISLWSWHPAVTTLPALSSTNIWCLADFIFTFTFLNSSFFRAEVLYQKQLIAFASY